VFSGCANGFSAMSDEVAQLQHELAMLRERYEIIERNGRRVRTFCLFALIPLAGIALYAFWKDFVAAAFVLAFLAIIAIPLRRLDAGKFRWIDVATPNSEVDLGPSPARRVEAAIAQGEKRLAELEREMSK
jgi:hypothetical protein